MEDREDNSSFASVLRKVLFAALVLILSVAVGVTAYTEYMLGKIGRESDSILQPLQTETTEQSNLAATEISELACQTDTLNILLIGQDRRPGQSKNARSDAMILCTVNQRAKSVTLISFMRDMYVQIPGKNSNRINAAYAIGGTKLLAQCIEENFGVDIDGSVVVDFAAFTDAIDLAGGVNVELTEKEAAYLNSVVYKDQPQWNTDLQAGVNQLDGNQALAYARIRKISGNDFGRTERQRKVLSALLNKVAKLTLPEIHKLMKDVLGQVSTDLTSRQIITYGLQLLPAIRNYQIKTQQIPAKGTYRDQRIDGMQVLVPDLDKNRELLNDIMA